MFQKLQQIKEAKKLYDQAKALQNALSQLFVTVEKNGVKIVMSADQKVQKIEIDGEENKKVAEAINEALKESQQVAAKKLQEMGGGLGNMFGGGK